jgi:DoxX
MDTRLDTPYLALRCGIGLTATLAGADKFFNLLTDWGMYLSPTAAAMLPVSPSAALAVVGVVEVCVGLAILTAWTRYGALAASVWLLAVAANLVLAGFADVAVRDIAMAIAAFTLARLAEVREGAVVHRTSIVAA